MKSFFRQISSRYFWNMIFFFKSFYYKVFLNHSRDVIVILTPGKVGSSSVYRSLKHKFPKSYIFHIHFLSEKNIYTGISDHKKSVRKSIPMHFITSLLFNSFFLKKSKRIKFVILFRDPVDRYISDMYQNYNRVLSKLNDKNNSDLIADINLGLSKMDHMDYLEKWIVDELHINLGYNFFERSKLHQNMYFIDSNNNYDFLFMKMESLNTHFSNAAKEFFNCDIKLKGANISSEKSYNSLYNNTKAKINIPQQITMKMKTYRYTTMIYPIN